MLVLKRFRFWMFENKYILELNMWAIKIYLLKNLIYKWKKYFLLHFLKIQIYYALEILFSKNELW